MRVTFGCGHAADVANTVSQAPTCPTCGVKTIARVSAPPPTFRGVCSGPHAVTVALAPATVNLCAEGASPLILKVSESNG